MKHEAIRQALADARILIAGDVMLDRYWFGDVERISPEAPVPVARIQRSEERAGGAANVARNIAAIGARATLLSVVGNDEAGASLEHLMQESGIRTSLHRDPSITTTVKIRVIARQQQLIRLDFEYNPSHEVLTGILDEYQAALADHDVVILSDYGKGGLTHVTRMIEAARAAGKPVLVDPKGDNYERYRGASLLTPNRSELRQVVGRWADDAELASKAESLRASLDLQALLVTRSEEGMSLFEQSGATHVPTVAREVYDVSGAGDTVIATLAAMLGAGQSLPDAMRWSNKAAGIVVGKLGTAVATADELFAD